jgi:hypothetical protein
MMRSRPAANPAPMPPVRLSCSLRATTQMTWGVGVGSNARGRCTEAWNDVAHRNGWNQHVSSVMCLSDGIYLEVSDHSFIQTFWLQVEPKIKIFSGKQHMWLCNDSFLMKGRKEVVICHVCAHLFLCMWVLKSNDKNLLAGAWLKW